MELRVRVMRVVTSILILGFVGSTHGQESITLSPELIQRLNAAWSHAKGASQGIWDATSKSGDAVLKWLEAVSEPLSGGIVPTARLMQHLAEATSAAMKGERAGAATATITSILEVLKQTHPEDAKGARDFLDMTTKVVDAYRDGKLDNEKAVDAVIDFAVKQGSSKVLEEEIRKRVRKAAREAAKGVVDAVYGSAKATTTIVIEQLKFGEAAQEHERAMKDLRAVLDEINQIRGTPGVRIDEQEIQRIIAEGRATRGETKRPSEKNRTWLCNIWGDPHILTLDGKAYDFQAVGEFLALKSTVDSLEVQVRHTPLPSSRTLSDITAVAMNVSDDHVGIYIGKEPQVRINGKLAILTGDVTELPRGGWLERNLNQYIVQWPDSSAVRIDVHGTFLNLFTSLSLERRGKVAGLLGNGDAIPANDLVTRDGKDISSTSLFKQQFFNPLYQSFGKSWRISQTESLFDYGPGQSTKTFTDLSFPDEPVSVAGLSSLKRRMAEKACRAAGLAEEPFLTACILDVGFTGNLEFAKSSVQTEHSKISVPSRTQGIVFQWTGTNSVGIDLVDSTQKFKLWEFGCGGGKTCTQNAAAGSYFLKVNAPGFTQLIPVNVSAAGNSEIKPAAGVISFQWTGGNFVTIDLVDSTQKFKLWEFGCGGGKTCTQDAAAGSYFLKVNAPGFTQLIPVNVSAAGNSEIKPAAGVISFQWTGANFVTIDLVDSTQKFKLWEFGCGGGGGNTCTQNAAAGSYFLKVNAPGFTQLIPVNVSAAGNSEIKPASGVISFQWTGANAVLIDVVDSTQKFKLGGVLCGRGPCTQDVAPGSYYLKVDAPGFNQLIPVNVTAGQTSQITR